MINANGWQPMSQDDLPQVYDIANTVHQDYPEDFAVFQERLTLFPQGCHILKVDHCIIGYIISHPWAFLQPPALNSMLGAIPQKPTTYYIHDLALLESARSAGWGAKLISQIEKTCLDIGISNISLVSVGKSLAFWQKHGFSIYEDPNLDQKLRSYDAFSHFMQKIV